MEIYLEGEPQAFLGSRRKKIMDWKDPPFGISENYNTFTTINLISPYIIVPGYRY